MNSTNMVDFIIGVNNDKTIKAIYAFTDNIFN